MMTPPVFRNRLLRTFPAAELDRLRPHLGYAKLAMRQELEQPNRPIERVFFIEEGIASVVTAGPRTDQVETGLIGPEGVTGVAVILGDGRTPHATFMQAAGHGYAIASETLQQILQASAPIRTIVLRFVQAFFTQMAQTAVANARLTLEARLARWLLMTQDRIGKPELPMTHEFLSTMLGVRRAGVTDAVHVLESQGAIRAQRGMITVLKRAALQARAGALYGLAEAEYERLLAQTIKPS
jgi:CRP-like cAMP-binding protein